MKVGNQIDVKEGAQWTFGSKTAEVFDTHVVNSIPLYKEGHALICYLSDFFLRKGARCYDIGSSTGTLLLSIYNINIKHVEYIGIEPESEMVLKSREKLGEAPVTIINDSIENVELEKCDFVVSYYTLQFIPYGLRKDICRKIFNALNPGGCFVLFEKEVIGNSYINKLLESSYMKFKISNKFTFNEILGKKFSIEGYLSPNLSNDNITMLFESGFNFVEPVMQYGEFHGYVAIKKTF